MRTLVLFLGIAIIATAQAPVSPAPVAWWTFDEASGLALDLVGSSDEINCVQTGCSPIRGIQGAIGGAVSLDGANDGIVFQKNMGSYDGGAFAISTWVRLTTSQPGTIYSHYTTYRWFNPGAPGVAPDYQTCGDHSLFTDVQGRVVFTARDGALQLVFTGNECSSVPATSVTSQSSLVVGNWHHIVAVRSGSTYSLYIDGVLENTAIYGGIVDSIASVQDATCPFRFVRMGGSNGWGNQGPYPNPCSAAFSGAFLGAALDETMIFDVALSSSDVAALGGYGNYPGTSPDLRLATGVNQGPSIGPDTKTAMGGDVVTVNLVSPGGTLNGTGVLLANVPYVAIEMLASGQVPIQALPGLWLAPSSPTVAILFSGAVTTALGTTYQHLSSGGINVAVQLPPLVPSSRVILQGLVLYATTGGVFETSDAHVLDLP